LVKPQPPVGTERFATVALCPPTPTKAVDWLPVVDGATDYSAAPLRQLATRGDRLWVRETRWASRITLEVVGVRVERLQDITENDAKAEGVEPFAKEWRDGDEPTAIASFAMLWDSINGKRAAWASNPWVWRVEFRKVESCAS
jgi:hypothetical protein